METQGSGAPMAEQGGKERTQEPQHLGEMESGQDECYSASTE